ncbi:hypothetical protein B0H10DRAFT_1962647 [Mycena sp. CBHHK59/15]|nr:hypothetical protein B0H10DRAFT_1962647 [Mycena sp. CBHHK59/15]
MKYATEILRQMNHMENEKEEVDDLNSCYSSATVEELQGSNKPHILEDGLDNIANKCDTVRDSVAEIAAGIGQIVIVRRNSGAAYKKPQSIRHFTLSTNLRPNPHLLFQLPLLKSAAADIVSSVRFTALSSVRHVCDSKSPIEWRITICSCLYRWNTLCRLRTPRLDERIGVSASDELPGR